jgi:D-3-phosphoglycerate dehydrogenase / 2-oxoglutarate reductase
MDRGRLGLMKPGAIFANTVRGALVDDVFAEEPLPRGHPLTRLDNVVLTARAAWMSPEAARRLV